MQDENILLVPSLHVPKQRGRSKTSNADVHRYAKPVVAPRGKLRSSRLNNAGRGRDISLPNLDHASRAYILQIGSV
jgi:hypothetical protein